MLAETGAFQYVQYTLLIWQEHCSRLHIHQPSHFVNDLSDHSMRFKRSDHGVRRFQQRAQLAEFFQPVALETDERTCQVTNLVITRGERGRIYRDGLLGGWQRLVLDGE